MSMNYIIINNLSTSSHFAYKLHNAKPLQTEDSTYISLYITLYNYFQNWH